MKRVIVTLIALALAATAGAARPVGTARPAIAGCENTYYERPGNPDLLVASDLPLESSAHTAMHQMTQSIKLTLKGRGFRAGRHSVGYVVCDDSGAAGSWSAKRCRQNARSFARTAKVVGIVGTLDSGCTRLELPIIGAATIVLVSPLNTASDLTRSRVASVARLSAPDDAQAAVAARFLRQQGARAAVALSDGAPRNDAYRSAFVRAARDLGVRIVERGRAEAAYVAGELSPRSRAELAAARRRAPSGPVVLSAGYGPGAQLRAEVGSLANGMYLAVAGVPVERLGSSGARFVRHFEAKIGTAPHPYAVYAAEAAEILFDAIAASNGTRASVARLVLATKRADSLIGPLAFDANGDLKRAPVTIFRVEEGAAHVVRVLDSGLP